MRNAIITPGPGLLGPDGLPVFADAPALVGINVYEAPGGDDSLSAIAAIAALRKRREKTATLVVAPGQITEGLLVEVAVFNAEVYQMRELTEPERARLAKAVKRRMRRAGRPVAAGGLWETSAKQARDADAARAVEGGHPAGADAVEAAVAAPGQAPGGVPNGQAPA